LPTPALAAENQTWWGFPTWRETLDANWNDPTIQPNVQVTSGAATFQPNGLTPRPANTVPVADDGYLLPPMAQPLASAFPATGDFTLIRRNSQLFSDAQGYRTMSVFLGAGGVVDPVWAVSWEDDLIMSNVRSFDVKAYDNALANYADLGWGDDVRSSGFNGVPFLLGNADNSGNNAYPPLVLIQGGWWDYINQTFAHEGRMPPLVADNRVDAFTPNPNYPNLSPLAGTVANSQNYTGNIGDDDVNNVGIVRLRRVWDSWSTAYTRAPATGINQGIGFPSGPPFSPPIYPSYPPPYPAPLRGIQIQIRVVDPTNQHIKSLTIRQDFTDKL
jgi:hypothetical protein